MKFKCSYKFMKNYEQPPLKLSLFVIPSLFELFCVVWWRGEGQDRGDWGIDESEFWVSRRKSLCLAMGILLTWLSQAATVALAAVWHFFDPITSDLSELELSWFFEFFSSVFLSFSDKGYFGTLLSFSLGFETGTDELLGGRPSGTFLDLKILIKGH